ncbi:MAG: aldo/keto reductase [Spirochaetales bacterium]|jgi:predicted aldo/keto reductase-like oxidoreductase|nr:aldo/keto reductase [Spirochaetales bacterium]
MEKRAFTSLKAEVSLLGFGCMRLPQLSKDKPDIDYELGQKMIDRAFERGVNYFDTAWMYHEGLSESFVGRALSKYPRESFYLATKMPSWLAESPAGVEKIFSEQLKKCKTGYFDFYLAHNLSRANFAKLRELGVYEFLAKKKEEGKIRRLGFSIHDNPETLEQVASAYPWEFAQIQLNYVDWETLDAKRQYEYLSGRGIPVIVMEPVRGGALASLNEKALAVLKKADPVASAASWAIRFAASLPNVLTVLSGMSNLEQVEDNLAAFDPFRPLSEAEHAVIKEAAAAYRASGTIPCSGCRYCMPCPVGVDIPRVFAIYNHYRALGETRMAPIVFRNTYTTLLEDEKAHNCADCGQCESHCPQGIKVPGFMKEIAAFAAAG